MTGGLHPKVFGAFPPEGVKVYFIRNVIGVVRGTRAARIELMLKIGAFLNYGGNLLLWEFEPSDSSGSKDGWLTLVKIFLRCRSCNSGTDFSK